MADKPEERKQVFAAALDEFAETGFTQSSLDSIAQRANLEVAVVRALFVSKETLLRELLQEECEIMSAIAVAVDEIDDPKEFVRESLKVFDRWMLDNPKATRAWVQCSLEAPGALRSHYERSLMPSEFYDRLGQIIDSGQIRCDDPFILNMLFESLIVFPHIMRQTLELIDPGQSEEEIFDRRFEAMMDLFEHGLFTN